MQRDGCAFCIRLSERNALLLEVFFDQCFDQIEQDCFCETLDGEIVSCKELSTNTNLRKHQSEVLDSAVDLLQKELGKKLEDQQRLNDVKKELASVGSVKLRLVEGVPLFSDIYHP